MKEHVYSKYRGIAYFMIKRLLTKGVPFKLKIAGTSMEPYLNTGDFVWIQCGNQNFEDGGLVLIDWGDTFVVHRLIDKQNMLTKGDNLDTSDPPGLKIVCMAAKAETVANI